MAFVNMMTNTFMIDSILNARVKNTWPNGHSKNSSREIFSCTCGCTSWRYTTRILCAPLEWNPPLCILPPNVETGDTSVVEEYLWLCEQQAAITLLLIFITLVWPTLKLFKGNSLDPSTYPLMFAEKYPLRVLTTIQNKTIYDSKKFIRLYVHDF